VIVASEEVEVAADGAGELQPHQLLGMADRQGAQQRLVKQSEDGRVGANTQRQSDDGDQGEDGRLAQLAQSKTEVLEKLHDHSPIVSGAFSN
jgi:hypothetical protein